MLLHILLSSMRINENVMDFWHDKNIIYVQLDVNQHSSVIKGTTNVSWRIVTVTTRH